MVETTIYTSNQAVVNPGVKINLLEGLFMPEVATTIEPQVYVAPKRGCLLVKLSAILASIGIIILAIYFVPGLISTAKYRLSGGEVKSLSEANENVVKRVLPAYDPTLPITNRLVITSIGVNTDIEEATYDNYESALKKGVWRVSNFGQPDELGAPVILAAHRYGYLAWTNSYRHYNSFYNLPKVKEGDIITIDWQQREYVYGVYKTENGEAISDYSADLILYTCESLSGTERVFVYARLI
jgi:sortase (surface protein transpeptidase)